MATVNPLGHTIIARTEHSTIETCLWNGISSVTKTSQNPHDARNLRRWKNEVDALKCATSHDNIASLLSSSPLNLTLTLRLEPGKSLDHFVDVSHHCTLAPADGAAVLCQQAGALSHLHSRRLIHDDVKPENIIWDPVAKRAVLIDFGAALNLATLPAGYFNPSGTPSYAPPEFFKRKKGPEGDVWALGVVLLFVWGYVRLPDGEWLLPGVWDEGGDVEMRRWLGEVSELRQRLTGGRPVLGEMLKEDPGERVSSAGLVCRLRAGEVS